MYLLGMTGKTKLSRTSRRTYPEKGKPLKKIGKRTYGKDAGKPEKSQGKRTYGKRRR